MFRLLTNPSSISFWVAIAIVTIFPLAELVTHHEEKLEVSTTTSGYTFHVYGNASAGRSVPYRDIDQSGDLMKASYGFLNFDNAALQLSYEASARKLKSYRKQYGYSQQQLDDLYQWQKEALQGAYEEAVRLRQSQTQLNKRSAEIQEQYRQKVRRLITGSGFKYLESDSLAPDMPFIVRKNVSNMKPVAQEIEKIARERGYDSNDVIGSTLSLMQTGLEYENIPVEVDGRVIGGIYPPMVVMAEGRGDCDSKTAVMAAILLNWDRARVIGVGVPGHYLIGVLQHPYSGDVYVEYEGLNYVLMEPAGPGWLPPGMVSDYTLDVLEVGDQVVLEALRRY